MIKINDTDESTTWSVDLLQHAKSGDRYVVKYIADWDSDVCTGGHVQYAAGPLNDAEVHTILQAPLDWDSDQELAESILNDEYIWKEIYAGHR